LLKEPFSFYSGYIQLSMNVKDEVLESEALAKLLKEIKSLKDQITVKDSEN